jgi:hypothetical protein
MSGMNRAVCRLAPSVSRLTIAGAFGSLSSIGATGGGPILSGTILTNSALIW